MALFRLYEFSALLDDTDVPEDELAAGVVLVDDHPPQDELVDVLGFEVTVFGLVEENPPELLDDGVDGFDDENPPEDRELPVDDGVFDEENPPDERLLDEDEDERPVDPDPAWLFKGVRNDSDRANVVSRRVNLFMVRG